MTAPPPEAATRRLGLMGLLLAAGLAGGVSVSEAAGAVDAAAAARRDAEQEGFSASTSMSYENIVERSTSSAAAADKEPARRADLRALADKAQAEATRAARQSERQSRAGVAQMALSRGRLRDSEALAALAAVLLAAAAWVAAAGWRLTPPGVVALSLAAAGVGWSFWPWLGR